MNKVLSVLLLISMTAATGAYGACERCEWKNCNNKSNWVVRKGRAAKCWVARRMLRRKIHSEIGAAELQSDVENNNKCTSKKCPIHNSDKKSKNFCNQCGRCHR